MLRTTLRQLEIFVAIAQAGTVTEAAEAVGLTQSAASMALAELERQIDAILFDRNSKRLVLNESGRILYPKAMELIDRAKELETTLSSGVGVVNLRLGASSTIGSYLIPQIIGRFAVSRPGSQISLDVGNTQSVIMAAKRYDIDIGFIEGPCHDRDVCTTFWRNDELAICAGSDHPLARQPEVSHGDLLSAKWILRERGSGTREVVDRILGEQLGIIGIEMEFGGTEAIKRAVESGLGISCLPRVAIDGAVARGTLKFLPAPFLKLNRQLYIVTHRKKYETRGIKDFLAHCLEGRADLDQAV